jgi:hypothetical protein
MKVTVLVFADFVFDLVDGQFRFELEEIVEQLDTAAGEMIEEVRIGTVLLVEHVGEREELLLGIEERLLDRFRRTLPLPRSLSMRKRMKAASKDILIETVVAQRIHELDEVLRAGGINDTQPVHIPSHRVAGFGDPPIVVVAEANDATSRERK